MKIRHRLVSLAVIGLLTGALVVGDAAPAGAAVTATASGTTITVTVTGTFAVSITCNGGTTRVNGAVTSPAVACGALTKVTVNGDSAQQIVNGDTLDAPAFAARPYLQAALGAGNDSVWDSLQPDIIVTGADLDTVTVSAKGAANTLVDLGNDAGPVDFDRFTIIGLPSNDTITTATSGATTTFTAATTTGTRSYSATSAEVAVINGNGGNDSLSTLGVTGASAVDFADITGGDGNDSLSLGSTRGQLFGGGGQNVLNGSPQDDNFYTRSSKDTINTGGGAGDDIYDQSSPQSGGRSIPSAGGTARHLTYLNSGDAVTRVRQGSSATKALITNSLTRPGQQELQGNVTAVDATLFWPSTPEPVDKGLADVHALQGKTVRIDGDLSVNDIADITMPSGSWGTSGTAATTLTLSPALAGYGNLVVTKMGAVSVHGPWEDPNNSFAHRVTRDLVFRFPSFDTRTLIATQLEAGTKTRAQVVNELMDTDEYRALDVDRVFVKYLRRAADPGGKAYWVNSIDNGKALWRFRAQLFGSPEYFTKAGGTNAKYVEAAYTDVLGRGPDPSGRTFWTNKLDNGADRGSVALQFINSPEARRRLVDEQFLRFLDRLPTTGEQTTWTATVASSTTGEQQLIAFLTASSAYFTRT